MKDEKLKETMDALLEKVKTAPAEEVRKYTKAYGDLFACFSFTGEHPLARLMSRADPNPFEGEFSE